MALRDAEAIQRAIDRRLDLIVKQSTGGLTIAEHGELATLNALLNDLTDERRRRAEVEDDIPTRRDIGGADEG